jgi:hypothetical protein
MAISVQNHFPRLSIQLVLGTRSFISAITQALQAYHILSQHSSVRITSIHALVFHVFPLHYASLPKLDCYSSV